MATLTRDRTVLDVLGSPLILFGVLNRETNLIVETHDNRVEARMAAWNLEIAEGTPFISIRLPVEYD
ncbi:MAG: hypothetical protein QQN46_04940 [Nitrosopumilus sp.]